MTVVKTQNTSEILDEKYSERVQLPAKVCQMVLLTWGHFISAFRYIAFADCGYD